MLHKYQAVRTPENTQLYVANSNHTSLPNVEREASCPNYKEDDIWDYSLFHERQSIKIKIEDRRETSKIFIAKEKQFQYRGTPYQSSGNFLYQTAT